MVRSLSQVPKWPRSAGVANLVFCQLRNRRRPTGRIRWPHISHNGSFRARRARALRFFAGGGRRPTAVERTKLQRIRGSFAAIIWTNHEFWRRLRRGPRSFPVRNTAWSSSSTLSSSATLEGPDVCGWGKPPAITPARRSLRRLAFYRRI